MNFNTQDSLLNHGLESDVWPNGDGDFDDQFRCEVLNWCPNKIDFSLFVKETQFLATFKTPDIYFNYIELLIFEEARAKIKHYLEQSRKSLNTYTTTWHCTDISISKIKHNFNMGLSVIGNEWNVKRDSLYLLHCFDGQSKNILAQGFAFTNHSCEEINDHDHIELIIRNVKYKSVNQIKEHFLKGMNMDINDGIALPGVWITQYLGDLSDFQRMYYSVHTMPKYPIINKLCGIILKEDKPFEFTEENFDTVDVASNEPYYQECVRKCSPTIAQFILQLNDSQKAVLIHCLEHLNPLLHTTHKQLVQCASSSSSSCPLSMDTPFFATLSVVKGPPGCGKTHVTCALIHLFLADVKKVLVTATTNKAVCVLLEKFLSTLGSSEVPKIAVDGRMSSMELHLTGISSGLHLPSLNSVDHLAANVVKRIIMSLHNICGALANSGDGIDSHTNAILIHDKLIEVMRSRFENIYCVSLMAAHERLVSALEKRQNHSKICEIIELLIQNHYDVNGCRYGTLRNLELAFVESADLVFCTLSYCGLQSMKENGTTFNVVIVDEAAQTFEPAFLVVLNNFVLQHVILIGDPKQLPPLLHSNNLKTIRAGLIMERLINTNDVFYVELNQQYRMHPDISFLPRHLIYGGRLKDLPGLESRQCAFTNPDISEIIKSCFFLNSRCICVGCDGKELRQNKNEVDNENASTSNLLEAVLVVMFLIFFRDVLHIDISHHACVITFYRGQVELIKRILENNNMVVEVATVDSFQGSEKEYILLSYVRSESIGFLKDERRLNVAWTRAKHFLVSIGNAKCLKSTGDGPLYSYWRECEVRDWFYEARKVIGYFVTDHKISYQVIFTLLFIDFKLNQFTGN
jgi:hypothetical protein